MKKYELLVEGFHTPLTAAEIAKLFGAGRVGRSDPCREVGQDAWRTLDELFPLLKYDSSGADSGGSGKPSRARVASAVDGYDDVGDSVRPMSSALKAGWICFGLGLLVSWIFPPGNLFFSIAIVTAVVAMCTHQVNRGLALLLTSFVGIGVCALVFMSLVVGAVGVAAAPTLKKVDADLKRMQQQQEEDLKQLDAASRQMQSAMNQAVGQLNTQLQTTPPVASNSSLRATSEAADRRRQYDLAMLNERERVNRKAADDAQRQQNVWEAERRRNAINAKEQQLQQVQRSIDSNDQFIRNSDPLSGGGRYFRQRRDELLNEKAKLQGR